MLKKSLKISLVVFVFIAFWLFAAIQPSAISKYLTLGAALFSIGLYGLFRSHSTLKALICLEILFNAAILNFIVFSYGTDAISVRGQAFSLFIMAIAAAEAALGLAIVIGIYRIKQTTQLSKISDLKG